MLRRSLTVAYGSCAVFAAQLLFIPATSAAVPIEESVGEQRSGAVGVQPATQPARQPSLDIPPTIEPTQNTDFGRSTPAPVTASPAGVPAGDAAVGGGQLSQLFYQLQVLQQEIQELRGQVEEQSYLVSRLQRDQKEQYLDLDRRVVALSENRPAPGPTTSAPVEPAGSVAVAGGGTEREAYTEAFQAMRDRNFDESMLGFQDLIERYPNGQFTPNAYYWMGELHLVARSDAEQARQAFMQVVSLYPDHQKAPDAMYKLGVVYHNLGDLDSARSYLSKVQTEHPNSSAAGLAAKYAAELN